VQDGHVSRRKFLGRASGVAVATIPFAGAQEAEWSDRRDASGGGRAGQAERIRLEAAANQRKRSAVRHQTNGDEARYERKLGSFGKGLPHNALGEVDPAAFAALTEAMRSGKPADFEALPVRGPIKLRNPQAGLAFDLQGPDSHALPIDVPPAFASAEIAGVSGGMSGTPGVSGGARGRGRGVCHDVEGVFRRILGDSAAGHGRFGWAVADAVDGAPLTVGNELNKLAGNIAMGRDAAGVHWRSDGRGGLALGEALALDYLAEMRALWNERFDGFSLTRFDGTAVIV
jgi:hypothetical protein